ncbi:hypothetical protein [Candidatus Nitrosotalea sp. TS]|nr:hypothetical protein [Candidatus Nitrosotalea sp. TS]
MGESVVSVFVYLGIGSAVLTSVVIGIILLGPVIEDIKLNVTRKSHFKI